MKKQIFGIMIPVLAIALFFTISITVTATQRSKRTVTAGTPIFPAVEYNAWLKVQTDPAIKDDDKVIYTINTYFNLKFKSQVRLELLDFRFLFDMKSAQGAEDYAYERGLYALMLTAWKEFNNPPQALESYTYEPKFNQLVVKNNSARVEVFPEAKIVIAGHKGIPDEGSYSDHSFTLIRKNDLWLIRSVVGHEEMASVYPHGTNFIKAIQKERRQHKTYL